MKPHHTVEWRDKRNGHVQIYHSGTSRKKAESMRDTAEQERLALPWNESNNISVDIFTE